MTSYLDQVNARIAASTELETGQTKSPTGGVTQTTDLTMPSGAPVGAGEMQGPPVAPAAEPAPQDDGQSIGRFLLESAYDAASKTPVAGYMGWITDAMDWAQSGESTGLKAGTAAAIDHAYLGGADFVIAADRAAQRWLGEGASFGTEFANEKQAVNFKLAEEREAHPIASTVGAMAGSAIAMAAPGGAVDKAFRGTSWFTRGVLVGGTSGALEAGTYRYNSDGTKEEILQDAGWGGLFGSAFGGAFALAGSRISNALGRTATKTEKTTARRLLAAVNARVAKEGQPEISPEDFTKLLNERGMEAVMADYYPDLLPLLKQGMAVQGTDGFAQANAVLAARTNMEKSFGMAVHDAVAAPSSRSLKEFNAATDQLQASLRPRYDTILNRAEAMGVKLKPKGLVTSLKSMLDDNPMGDAGQMKSALASIDDILRGKVDNGVVTPRALHNAKREFYRANRGNPAAKPIYDQINDWLGQIDPEYTALANTYSNSIDVDQAYTSGYRYMTGDKTTPDDVLSFADRLTTRGEVDAFVNGLRRKLAEDLQGKTPKAIENFFNNKGAKVDLLRAVMGKERVDDLMGAVFAEVNARQVTDTMRGVAKDVVRDADIPNEVRNNLANMVIATNSPGQSPGKLRALVNTLLQPERANPEVAASMMAETATTPLSQAGPMMEELGRVAQRGTADSRNMRAMMAAGAGSGAYNETASEVRGFDPQRAANALPSLRDMLMQNMGL